MYSGKQMRHTTKLFKNTNLKNCLLRPGTLEKASKKDKNKIVFEKWDLPEEMPKLWMQFKRQIGVCFLPNTLYTYRLSETTLAG